MTNSDSAPRKKAVAYLKGSTARVASDYDLPSTTDRQRAVIEIQADKLGADIVAEFITTSGRCGVPVTEYPEFQDLLATIRERGIDYVIVYRHGIYHDHERTAEMMLALQKEDVLVYSATEGFLEFAVRSLATISDYFDLLRRRQAQLDGKRRNRKAAA